MNPLQKAVQRKIQRRENRTKVRQALLVNEYVYYKYFTVYQEAAQFYNEINSKYPVKYDLRRTDEFKAWKMSITGQPVRITSKLPKPYHTSIPVTNGINSGSSFTVICDGDLEQCEQSISPEQCEHPTSSEQCEQSTSPEQCEQSTTPEQCEQSISPEQCEQPTSSEQCEQSTSPEQCEQSTTPEQCEQSTSSEQCEQAANPEQPVSPSVKQAEGEKVMQLRIPLLEPSVVTQTLQIVTEETLQENSLQVAAEEVVQETTTLYPSLHEEIPSEVIDRIIRELREDPELRNIMTDLEQDLEFEQIGMDVDIPEDVRLENELNWEIW